MSAKTFLMCMTRFNQNFCLYIMTMALIFYKSQIYRMTWQEVDQSVPAVFIDNEDDTYNTFVKLIVKSGLLKEDEDYQQVKAKISRVQQSLGAKFKKIEIYETLYPGKYSVTYKGEKFIIVVEFGQAKLVTECRMVDYLKRVRIEGSSLQKVKEFTNYIFNLVQDEKDTDIITIYENQGGYWRVSKQKKPRKLESVIFKKQFTDSVLQDIHEFIDSEAWYTEMGVPYKRSYLLYGPPGTGKSSFAQAIAAAVNFSICFVNCSDKINDFNFNSLLNTAPKKSVILIEDVDAIFTERKNTDRMNALTFSGFLNAIDGVRSQEGRIIIMTTNYKDKLDPALLRPGRVDQMYEIGYASRYQIEKLCFRFFKNQQIAKQFAAKLPEGKFAMSMIQGFLLKYRKTPEKIVQRAKDILDSDQNVKIQVFLKEVNCLECLTGFRMQEVYSLAQAKNLPQAEVDKIASKLDETRKGRLTETIRLDRKHYIKTEQAVLKFIEQSIPDQDKQRKIRKFVQQEKINTLFAVRDKVKELQAAEQQEKKPEQKKE